MRKVIWISALVLAVGAVGAALPEGGGMMARTAATPQELVSTYSSLADTILALDKTEYDLVRSILATTYGHAEGTVREIHMKQGAGKDCKADVEKLADLVSQLGNEGDASVAAIRKRLLEGGHHHHAGHHHANDKGHHANAEKGHHANAEQGEESMYDEGFVIVTKDAKKNFLAIAGDVAKLGGSPNLQTLDAQWKKVTDQYAALFKEH